jgi:hypothetical protein
MMNIGLGEYWKRRALEKRSMNQKSTWFKPLNDPQTMSGFRPGVVRRRALLLASVMACQATLSACATEQYTFHSFSFDAFNESPNVEVLNYAYGAKSEYERVGGVGLRPADYQLARGETFSGAGITGTFPKGDYLYVKWRIKSTGQIEEDTVDLTTRLPKDITQHEIHFVIVDAQLVIYLIPPPGGFDTYYFKRRNSNAEYAAYFKKHQIYPN